MNLVSYGGGTNSTAMLIGMHRNNIPVDLILFADTGGEMPETYEYIDIMNGWLIGHGMPTITVVEYKTKDGQRMTLEQECLKVHNLPSIAYGFKTCSMKHKMSTQDKYCNSVKSFSDTWKNGEKVSKYIGFDAGEERRKTNAIAYDIVNKKYKNHYPLIDLWDWYREDCVQVIKEEGLSLPGKSSCFFCPSMKKHEIKSLRKKHPDLFERAIAIEQGAMESLVSVKGLGRNYSWKDFIEWEESQVTLCDLFEEDENSMPCGCYD